MEFRTSRQHICIQFTEIEGNQPNVFTAHPERSVKKMELQEIATWFRPKFDGSGA